MPARILTIQNLREAQLSIAHRAEAPLARQQLPLPASCGRVLAQDLDMLDTEGRGSTLAAGTRLDWYLLPLLAASGHASVPVFTPVRCGIVTRQACGDTDDERDPMVGAVMLQAALEKIGVRSSSASVNRSPLSDPPSLEAFARHCDLLLVIDKPAAGRPTGPGLTPPPTFQVGGRVCVVLPPCPLAALATFLVFVVPLIRKLQGRSLELAPFRIAVEEGTDLRLHTGSSLTCVTANASATRNGDAIKVKPCAPDGGRPVQGIADVCGVAWGPENLCDARGRLLAYLPLDEWLH